MNRHATIGELRGLLDIASDDELNAFAVIARKVMGPGRDNYGPAFVRNDARNYMTEAGQEGVDAVFYAALEIVRRTLHPERPSIALVREFHERFGQVVNDEPSLDDRDLSALRIRLLAEELDELNAALGMRDPVAVLDALTDLQYVLDGAYLSLGLHAVKDAALREVHRSNMSKLGADGRPVYRRDGKVTKGPNYSPPDLRSILAPSSTSPTSSHPEGGALIVSGPHALVDFDDETPTGERFDTSDVETKR